MKITAKIEFPKKLTAKFKELKMPLSGGYDEGYKDGYEKGETDGFKNGHDVGFSDGYDKGYDQGYKDGDKDIPTFTSLRYAFAYDVWDNFLDVYGHSIKTQGVTNCQNLFHECNRLRNIDFDFFESMDLSLVNSCSSMFFSCYSLRKLPNLDWLSDVKITSQNSSPYYTGFPYCYVLDEICDLPVINSIFTSNVFGNTFIYGKRLKDITFKTDNGKPIAVNWSKQTMELSNSVGYTTFQNGIDTNITTGYNSGITKDKYVDNAASYEALKDDPDWYGNLEFTRYNIDSAIRTIASLPDVSSGSSNVIKFKGTAGNGSSSDGRTINQLTAE